MKTTAEERATAALRTTLDETGASKESKRVTELEDAIRVHRAMIREATDAEQISGPDRLDEKLWKVLGEGGDDEMLLRADRVVALKARVAELGNDLEAERAERQAIGEERDEALQRITELEAAIRKHRDGANSAWDDVQLHEVLGEELPACEQAMLGRAPQFACPRCTAFEDAARNVIASLEALGEGGDDDKRTGEHRRSNSETQG